jgi:hypothetical protein
MTNAQALRKINKSVAKAVRATLRADKEWQKAKRLEQQLKEARGREYAACHESQEYFAVANEEGFDWAVIQIGEAIQRGGTIEGYLQELLEHSPKDYVRLLTS